MVTSRFIVHVTALIACGRLVEAVVRTMYSFILTLCITYTHMRTLHTGERSTESYLRVVNFFPHFPSTTQYVLKKDEAQVQLALQALENDPKLSLTAAARIYSVHHTKLSRRRRGK